jgi:hypothetical protein
VHLGRRTKEVAPLPFGHRCRRGRGDEVDEHGGEALRRLAVRVVANVLEYLEAAAGNGPVGGKRVAYRNERVPGTPDDERGNLRRQV